MFTADITLLIMIALQKPVSIGVLAERTNFFKGVKE
jgi:hypothetical protein